MSNTKKRISITLTDDDMNRLLRVARGVNLSSVITILIRDEYELMFNEGHDTLAPSFSKSGAQL